MLSISVIVFIYIVVAAMVLVLLIAQDSQQKLKERRIYQKLMHNLEELQSQEWEIPMEAYLQLQMVPFPMRCYAERMEVRDEINILMVKISRKLPRENARK